MAKPILTVGVPLGIPLSKNDHKHIENEMKSKCPDYNIIVYVIPHNEVAFQVFYEKDQIPIDYDGLRKLITDNMKS